MPTFVSNHYKPNAAFITRISTRLNIKCISSSVFMLMVSHVGQKH